MDTQSERRKADEGQSLGAPIWFEGQELAPMWFGSPTERSERLGEPLSGGAASIAEPLQDAGQLAGGAAEWLAHVAQAAGEVLKALLEALGEADF